MPKQPCPFCGYVEVKESTREGSIITQCTSCSAILQKQPKEEETE